MVVAAWWRRSPSFCDFYDGFVFTLAAWLSNNTVLFEICGTTLVRLAGLPHRSGLPASQELSKLVFGLRPAEIDERVAEIPAAIQVNENVSRLFTASGHAMSFV